MRALTSSLVLGSVVLAVAGCGGRQTAGTLDPDVLAHRRLAFFPRDSAGACDLPKADPSGGAGGACPGRAFHNRWSGCQQTMWLQIARSAQRVGPAVRVRRP